MMMLFMVVCVLQDPEETDAWAGFKKIGEKLLNFGGQSKPKVCVRAAECLADGLHGWCTLDQFNDGE
jgi:hypothetical protein